MPWHILFPTILMYRQRKWAQRPQDPLPNPKDMSIPHPHLYCTRAEVHSPC